MLISVKFKESATQKFSVKLKDGNERDQLVALAEENIPGNRLQRSDDIQYNKDILLMKSHFSSDGKATKIVEVEGDSIHILQIIKMDAPISLSRSSIQLKQGVIYCGVLSNTEMTVDIAAQKNLYCRSIFISRNYFSELMKKESWANNFNFYRDIYKNAITSPGKAEFLINYKLDHLLEQITGENWGIRLGKHYLELRLKELFLCLHLQEGQILKNNGENISAENLKKVEEAHAFLVLNYKNPPVIKALSRLVLLNEFELKRDFKRRYQKTIRSYIIELRMKKAKNLIGKHSVGDIAGMLGYKSVPHFITTFKNYYGHTPAKSFKK